MGLLFEKLETQINLHNLIFKKGKCKITYRKDKVVKPEEIQRIRKTLFLLNNMELHLNSYMKLVDVLGKQEVTKPILEAVRKYIARVQQQKQRNFPQRYCQFPQKASDPDGFMEIVYCVFDELATPMLFKLLEHRTGNKIFHIYFMM